jgi:DNA-binding LytR/AlgR family response regulator
LKLKCIVVDDEFLARQLLEGYVQNVPYLELVCLCESAIEALQVLQEKKIDLIFLDVNMPELNGINFIKSLRHKPEIILTTAYSEHALEGYQLDVVEYLLKPIYFERFVQAVTKAKDLIELKATARGSSGISASEGNYIFIKTGAQKTTKVNLPDIVYIESMHEYVRIHLKSENFTIHYPLKGVLDILPANQFIQIHRSFIINFQHVSEIEGNVVKLGQTELSVGKNFKDEFHARIKSNSIGQSKTSSKADTMG